MPEPRAKHGSRAHSAGRAPASPPAVERHVPTASELVQAKRPIALHTHSYTYAYSRQQHQNTRTSFVRAYCPGLHGIPEALPNTGFYDEMDERLKRQHDTMTSLYAKGVAQHSHAHGDAGAAADTVALRHTVNQSLTAQFDFYNKCMAAWCLSKADGCARCACPGCTCACAEARHLLQGQSVKRFA